MLRTPVPRRAFVWMSALTMIALSAVSHASATVAGQKAACVALANADFSHLQDAATQLNKVTWIAATTDTVAYCQVQGYVSPQVGFEVRLPATAWNGRFMEVGCGGSCGLLNSDACQLPVNKGYACVASDMGHRGKIDDFLWAQHNVQAQIDYGYRATHVALVAGKGIASEYYGASPAHSYFVGCSTGGYQGVMAAQRYPWDFDGILAGAPDIDEGAAYLRSLWIATTLQDGAGRPRLTQGMLELLHRVVLKKCDMDDGVEDGVIGNPQACNFDPGELLCPSGQSESCLSASQVEIARKMYAGPMTSSGQKTSTGGYLPGSELIWNHFYPASASEQFFKYGMFGYSSPSDWKSSDFDFDRDHQRFGVAPWYENSNPDLRKFKQAGGKLMVYHGGNDTIDLPGAMTDYYETVERTMGGRGATQVFFRLFFIPGMQHCSLGDGAFAVDYFSYLEDWVEHGRVPEKLISAHVEINDLLSGLSSGDLRAVKEYERRTSFPLDPKWVTYSRPVYPYPIMAKYRGTGATNDAANFIPVQNP